MNKKPYFRPKLLIISDVAHTRAWLKRNLEEQFDIIIETRASTALQAAKNLELDFIVFDASLSNCKEVEFCEQLTRVTYKYQTLIYVITGKLKKTYLSKLTKAGAHGFINSILSDEELEQKISEGLASHESQRKTSDLFSALDMPKNLSSQVLKNRFSQSCKATMEIAESKENETPLSMVMIKVDKYAEVHRTDGKQVADELMEDVSKTIQKNLRKEDILIPTSNGKFVVIMPNAKEPKAEKFAKDLQNQVSKQRKNGSISMAFSSSISKRSEASYKEFNRLIRAADRALKETKTNQIIHFKKDKET